MLRLLKNKGLGIRSTLNQDYPWCLRKREMLATWCEEPTQWKRPWCCEILRAREGGSKRWDGGWRHWLNGCEFEQSLGDSEGQGSLACCSSWGCSVRHDWATEQWAATTTWISIALGQWQKSAFYSSFKMQVSIAMILTVFYQHM